MNLANFCNPGNQTVIEDEPKVEPKVVQSTSSWRRNGGKKLPFGGKRVAIFMGDILQMFVMAYLFTAHMYARQHFVQNFPLAQQTGLLLVLFCRRRHEYYASALGLPSPNTRFVAVLAKSGSRYLVEEYLP